MPETHENNAQQYRSRYAGCDVGYSEAGRDASRRRATVTPGIPAGHALRSSVAW